MENSFLSKDELMEMGFRRLGNDVRISRKASFFQAGHISVGDHVRIDDFCILSGDITLGSCIHISAYTALYGRFGIEVGNFATISGRVLIYSQNDDYSGAFMTNPMVPEEFTHITGGKVTLEKHVIIAAGSVLLPGITLREGSCLGAMSLLKRDTDAWSIYTGIPAKMMGPRERNILELERQFYLKYGPLP